MLIPTSRKHAFTLIELLTVIAIFAILAAILFPVAGTVREQARASDCMTNLHQLWVSANVYREDEGAFPPTLLGYPEGIIADPNNNNVLIHVPWEPGLQQVGLPNGNPNPAIPIDSANITNGYLFREDVKDINTWRCPDNNLKDTTLAVYAFYPDVQTTDPSQPYYWNPKYQYIGTFLQAQGCQHIAGVGTQNCYWNIPASDPVFGYMHNQPVWYYAIDSYDIGPVIDPSTGNKVIDPNAPGGQTPYFHIHYSPDWTGVTGANDLPEQLKYQNPPDDKTLLAFCSWHQAVAKSNRMTAVSMSGTAKQFTYQQVLNRTVNLYNQPFFVP